MIKAKKNLDWLLLKCLLCVSQANIEFEIMADWFDFVGKERPRKASFERKKNERKTGKDGNEGEGKRRKE